MMDALAADRLLGESPPEVFAFASYRNSRGGKEEAEAEWLAKNVTPILYWGRNRHLYLHRTLREWAKVYRDGVHGKESIVRRHARNVPSGSTREDDFVGRMLWALSDKTGLPARHFGELNPLPSLDWLEPLCDSRFQQIDLERFGVRANDEVDKKLRFSLASRPTPYTHSPLMRLVTHEAMRDAKLDHVMRGLAKWLARHVDNIDLLLWVAGQGTRLHDEFAWHLQKALKDEPVREVMMRLWHLVLSGLLHDDFRNYDMYQWRKHLVDHGYSPKLRFELVRMLAPLVKFSRPIRLHVEEIDANGERVGDLVRWEISLAGDYGRDAFQGLEATAAWQEALIDMLPDFTGLLRDVLDLMRELDGADDESDRSYISRPAIERHEQNRHYDDWTFLIDLIRQAWSLALAATPQRARAEAERWRHLPYPLFKRLAFFAATHRAAYTAAEALDLLLAGERWIWSVETQYEAIRLIVSVAPDLNDDEATRLQEIILNGPPRELFGEGGDAAQIERIIDREIWLRLCRIAQTGAILREAPAQRLAELEQRYPRWQLEDGDRDDFPFWMSTGGEWGTFTRSPIELVDLVGWLRNHQRETTGERDDWQERCQKNLPRTALALLMLAREGQWYGDRWRVALQNWAQGKALPVTWHRLADPLSNSPDEFLRSIAHAITWWLEAQSKVFTGQEDQFFVLVHRLLELHRDDGADLEGDLLFQALNHPIGHVAQAVVRWWYRQNLKDREGLHERVAPVFTAISDVRIESYRHGRMILCANLIALFRVDLEWTKQHVLPLFDWDRSEVEASAAWQGFLWSWRLYPPVFHQLKREFLATAARLGQLGTHADQYAALLTYAALEGAELFTVPELRQATAELTEAGLRQASHTLIDALEGAGDQRADYWRNRIAPYVQHIWPKTDEARTHANSENFARVCIAAGDAFPDALAVLRRWLLPSEHTPFAVHRLHEAGLCSQFPNEGLEFLDAMTSDAIQWASEEMEQCLDQIRMAQPGLEQDRRYQRLSLIIRRFR